MESEMRIERLTIERTESWQTVNPNRYVATVEYKSPKGEIKMPLTPEISERLLEFVAPLIARLGAEAAQEIAANIYKAIEASKPATQIEAQSTAAAESVQA